MKQFMWKMFCSWYVCNWGPFRLSVDPPDEHSHGYTWGVAVKMGILECGVVSTLDEAKQKAQDFAVSFVREVSELDIS